MEVQACHEHPVKKANFATVKSSTFWILKIKLNLRRNIEVVTDSWLVFRGELGLGSPFYRNIGYRGPSSIVAGGILLSLALIALSVWRTSSSSTWKWGVSSPLDEEFSKWEVDILRKRRLGNLEITKVRLKNQTMVEKWWGRWNCSKVCKPSSRKMKRQPSMRRKKAALWCDDV